MNSYVRLNWPITVLRNLKICPVFTAFRASTTVSGVVMHPTWSVAVDDLCFISARPDLTRGSLIL
ncbi:MAG: hypothetical protein GXP19_09810 [Gammaproteobacteria bacterium]|nr:hypothetical protein [Gammaproteobacteria bacterium]